jgi:hypothetical protein
MASYELWNMASGNLAGVFPSEDEALEAVVRHGESYVQNLALGLENTRGRSRVIASGRDLVERAAGHRSTTPKPRASRQDRIA